jgi:hypothetical protein
MERFKIAYLGLKAIVCPKINSAQGGAMHPRIRLWTAFGALVLGCILGYCYWPSGFGLLAILGSAMLLLPVFFLAVVDVYRARNGQQLPEFMDMNVPPPRPLFTGYLADALDHIANLGASIFGLTLVVGGLVWIGYLLFLLVSTFFT